MVNIKSLTYAENKYLKIALETLRTTSAIRSTEYWAANVMLEKDERGLTFIDRLLIADKVVEL